MNEITGPMETVSRLYQQLDEKTSTQGGLENVLGMNRKMRGAMAVINSNDLQTLLREIDRTRHALDILKEDIVAIWTLKEVFDSTTHRVG